MARRKVAVKTVDAKEIQALRAKWLVSECLMLAEEIEGDARPRTRHLGALSGGRILGIVSLFNEPRPGLVEASAWRLQGLAVAPSAWGEGVGRSLIAGVSLHLRNVKGSLLWANVPVSTCDFFRALKFEIAGDPFELPGLAPHHRILLNPKPR
jgi:GNAT superfamily N-acetyltransferase